MESMNIQGVDLILSQSTEMEMEWVGHQEVKRQLEASWLIISNQDLPMNPRIIGRPGIGKTTLAYAVARSYTPQVYIFQCTVDTRPEDLLVTPVIGSQQEIRYHASPLVTAMLKGGICVLDEGNRMSEKSWASLAPLLDTRRYVESIIAGIKIPAHPDFRLAVTMNDDASTFDVPDYIQSRLQPQIEVGFPSAEEELEILKVNLPEAPEEVLKLVGEFLQLSHNEKKPYTTRDGVNIGRYAFKLLHLEQSGVEEAVKQALGQVLNAQAQAFFESQILAPPPPVLKPLDVLLLGTAPDDPYYQDSYHPSPEREQMRSSSEQNLEAESAADFDDTEAEELKSAGGEDSAPLPLETDAPPEPPADPEAPDASDSEGKSKGKKKPPQKRDQNED